MPSVCDRIVLMPGIRQLPLAHSPQHLSGDSQLDLIGRKPLGIRCHSLGYGLSVDCDHGFFVLLDAYAFAPFTVGVVQVLPPPLDGGISRSCAPFDGLVSSAAQPRL